MMPFDQDPGKRTSEKYCSLCYQDGRLNAEGSSLKEFQDQCYRGMKERGLNPLLAKFYAFMIRFAPYWKQRRQKTV